MYHSRQNKPNRFKEAIKRRRIQVSENEKVQATEYPCRLQLYLRPPPAEITIEEFEQYALDRLQVLKIMDTATLQNKTEDEGKRDIQQALDKYLPMTLDSNNMELLMEERRKDHISHFVLRLVYCRTEESREWLLQKELALFRFRYEQEPAEERERFLDMMKFDWKVVDSDTKKALQPYLESCAYSNTMESKDVIADYVKNETFFEVKFEKAVDLLQNRGAYLHKGKVYVPKAKECSLVLGEFGARLSRMLEATEKSLPRMEDDGRLNPILMNINKQYGGNMYAQLLNVDEDLKASDVDMVVNEHAPLCMKTLHSALRRDNHLKYNGRMQYGLFLKAIGLSIEEALLFWRTAFSNKTDEQFQKEYAYNIRHNYGLEGKRVDYTAYSCRKIIRDNAPSIGDYHGCPFRHFSSGNLEARLHKDKLLQSQVKELMDLVCGSHYQVACTKYFEFTHPQHQNIDVIEHPNSYYDLSLDNYDGSEENK